MLTLIQTSALPSPRLFVLLLPCTIVSVQLPVALALAALFGAPSATYGT